MNREFRSTTARQVGFTLVEMMFSTAIFVMMAAIGASILIKTTSFYTESICRSDVMESAKIAQERAFDQLYSAKLVSLEWLSQNQPVLTFVVPLELSVAGGPASFLDGQGKVNWGAMEPTGPKLDQPGSPHRFTITVVPTGTVEEKASKLDFNLDKDRVDTFQTGSLVMKTSQGKDMAFLQGRLILGLSGGGAIDIDGDAVPDPVFKVTGETFIDTNKNGMHDDGESYVDTNHNGRWDGALDINILAFVRNRDGQGHRFVYKTKVKLVNNS